MPACRERESHLLNPPPGSTDPERFATVSIGIGDRVLFHPAPREPRHEWCEVSLRTEAGRSQATCLGLFDGLSVRPVQATLPTPHSSSWTQARGRRAMPTLPQARGELCSGDRRGERIADTVGHRAGSARRTGQALSRFYPLGWSRAITCRGVCKEVADAQSDFSGPAKAILSLRTGRLGGAGNPLTRRGPISISVSAAPTCNGSGIPVVRSDDAPRINGSERTRPQGNDGRPILRRALGGPQELRRDLRRARRRGR
mmetsp:Transcript_10529/g.31189  ORF Transcript_10529/g.31189 Transcript_10529/m.31189 type:complete len:257 (-) Transcript_10529:27-797(-)